MNETYLMRVAKNILPLSVSDSLPEAFQEWFFTEEICDHGESVVDCELCEKTELRYHFKIENENTSKSLWVGSSCILKFDVAVYEDRLSEVNGARKKLDRVGAKKKLDALTKKMQKDACLKFLYELAESEKNDIFLNAIKYYEKNGSLTPKYARVIFWRLHENNVEYHPSFFKIELKKDKHKNDLREMETYQVHHFWWALTSSQRKIAERLGHFPPKNKK